MLIENQVLGTSFGAGGSYKKDIERSIKMLGFKFEYAADLLLLENSTTVAAILGGIKASIKYVTKHAGQANHCVGIPLDALAEHWAAGESVIRTTRFSDGDLQTIQFCLDISDVGAIMMLDDETMTIDLTGLPTAAGFKMSIWGIEAPVSDFTMKQWHQLQVPANTFTKQFEAVDYSELVCPRSTGAFQSLQLTYSNGRVINVTEEEAQLIALDSNDLAMAGNYDESIEGFGFSSHYVLDIKNCTQILVTTNGAAYNIYAVADQVIGKPSKAAETVNGLQDVSNQKIRKEAFLAEAK